MVVENLPEVNPPSGRVPGQGLLAALILESRRRRNKQEIAKRVPSCGFSRRGVNIGQRGARGGPRGPGGHQGAWSPSGAPLAAFRGSGRFLFADFIGFF